MAKRKTSEIRTGQIKYGPAAPTRTAFAGAETRRPVAVLVCHGMGQQVRFETISAVAQSVVDEAATLGGNVSPVDVHLARANGDFLARAEINWVDVSGARHDVDVYEAYWAPLTEGKVSYWDTMKFLLQAGWKGLVFSNPVKRPVFERWLFGDRKKLEITGNTFAALLFMTVLMLGTALGLAFIAQQSARLIKDLGQLDFLNPNTYRHIALRSWLRWFGWLCAIGIAAVIRYFIVHYVGSVAAYVSPYKDSKFDELRHQIQAIGLNVGKVIYGFDDSTETVPHYERVVVIGHSLGSVVAYDTLNALINLDNVCGAKDNRQVVKRTRALITFGSPLDKTAFIFRMQANDKQDWMREMLSASIQPLIGDYDKYRPATHFRWVNIWAPRDIISGELNYYDDPAVTTSDPRHIVNMIDPDARRPLLAHVQYWKNPMLAKQIHEQVTRP